MKKFLVVSILLIAHIMFADFRKYVWTYEATIMPKGEWELENYFTHKNPDTSKSNDAFTEYWIEVEHGLSDYLDVSLYNMFKFGPGGKSEFAGIKPRLRYKPWLSGEKFLDFVFYIEPKLLSSSLDKPEIEIKLIFTKPVNRFSFSSNLIYEWGDNRKRGDINRFKNEYKLQFATRYEFSPRFSVGAEFETKFHDTRAGKSPTYFLGPTISYGSNKFWIASGVRFGLNNKTNDVEFRTIFGIEF